MIKLTDLGGGCSCGVDYNLNADGKTCDYNYCYNSNGGCAQTCTAPSMSHLLYFALFSYLHSVLDNFKFKNPKVISSKKNKNHKITPGGTCTCAVGYVLGGDGKACDVDQCYNSNNNGCDQTCISPGLFYKVIIQVLCLTPNKLL